jgi:hypothetical protein
VLEGDFFAIGDVVDGLLSAPLADTDSHGLVTHEGGHVEDDVLTIHPSADTQGAARHPSVFVGGLPSLLEGGLELLPQMLWVLVLDVDGVEGLPHLDAEFRDRATDCVTPTGTPWVGRESVIAQLPRLVGEVWVSWSEQDGVTAVSEGAAIGFSNELEVGVFVGLHVCECFICSF